MTSFKLRRHLAITIFNCDKYSADTMRTVNREPWITIPLNERENGQDDARKCRVVVQNKHHQQLERLVPFGGSISSSVIVTIVAERAWTSKRLRASCLRASRHRQKVSSLIEWPFVTSSRIAGMQY